MSMTSEEARNQALSSAKKAIDRALDGIEIIRGANCTIKETEILDEGVKVVFEWIGTTGMTMQTQILVPVGPQGEQGLQGIQGIPGDTGVQGPEGPPGKQGEAGQGFAISKIYETIELMNTDADKVNEGLFVAALTDDGVKIYLSSEVTVEDEIKGDFDGYKFILDLAEASVIRGEKGEDGKTPTIKIGKVTNGDKPSVKNSGTETDAILDFVLPEGGTGGVAETFIDITQEVYENIKDVSDSVTATLGGVSFDSKLNRLFYANNTNRLSTGINNTNTKELVLTFDLGDVFRFNSLGIITGYGCPKNITVCTSIDGETYDEVCNLDGNKFLKTWVANKELLLLLPMIETRYFKLICNGVFSGNRYEINKLKLYLNKDFDLKKFVDYNNESGIPYYFKKETYSKQEIDRMISNTSLVQFSVLNATVDSGSFNVSRNSCSTSLNTNAKQLKVDLTLSASVRANVLYFEGTGYGGLNDFDILISNDEGVSYELLESITSANILNKNEGKYVGLPKVIETKYLRILMKKVASGNRYEFANFKLYLDKQIDSTPSFDYVNSERLIKVSVSDYNDLLKRVEALESQIGNK